MMDTEKSEFIRGILERGVFKLEDIFIDGVSAPYYVDLRAIASEPELFAYAVNNILEYLLGIRDEFDNIIGIETASLQLSGGISLASIILNKLDGNVKPIPSPYLRRKLKDNSRPWKQVEGHFQPEDRAVLVDDLTLGYELSEDFIHDTRRAGLNVVGFVVIFEKKSEDKARDIITGQGMHYYSIFNYRDLIQVIRDYPDLYSGSDIEDRIQRIISFAES